MYVCSYFHRLTFPSLLAIRNKFAITSSCSLSQTACRAIRLRTVWWMEIRQLLRVRVNDGDDSRFRITLMMLGALCLSPLLPNFRWWGGDPVGVCRCWLFAIPLSELSTNFYAGVSILKISPNYFKRWKKFCIMHSLAAVWLFHVRRHFSNFFYRFLIEFPHRYFPLRFFFYRLCVFFL